MKIIKHGQIPEEQPIRATCSSCNTIVEFTKNEALVRSWRNEIMYIVTCPVCNREICGYD